MTTVDLGLVNELDAVNTVAGDLRVSSASLVVVSGGEAVAQEVQCRLRWWRGEWFLDVADGVPYLEQLVQKGVSEVTIRSVLIKEIEKVPDVARVTQFELSLDRQNRYATINIEILTTDAEVIALGGIAVGG